MADETQQAYPLQWPTGVPRTNWPERSRFKTTQNVAQDELMRELSRLGASRIVMSTNIQLRRDGLPYANQKVSDVGVAVYFWWKKKQHCIAIDKFDRIGDNIWAICKTIEAIRGIERWGGGRIMEAAFTGFQALPAPMVTPAPWWEVLQLSETASVDEIRDSATRLARIYHPDQGTAPDLAKMQDVNRAKSEGLKLRGIGS